MTHFEDIEAPGHRTLCGQKWKVEVWRSDPKADCVRCQDVWVARTRWAFPLPELVA